MAFCTLGTKMNQDIVAGLKNLSTLVIILTVEKIIVNARLKYNLYEEDYESIGKEKEGGGGLGDQKQQDLERSLVVIQRECGPEMRQ